MGNFSSDKLSIHSSLSSVGPRVVVVGPNEFAVGNAEEISGVGDIVVGELVGTDVSFSFVVGESEMGVAVGVIISQTLHVFPHISLTSDLPQ